MANLRNEPTPHFMLLCDNVMRRGWSACMREGRSPTIPAPHAVMMMRMMIMTMILMMMTMFSIMTMMMLMKSTSSQPSLFRFEFKK